MTQTELSPTQILYAKRIALVKTRINTTAPLAASPTAKARADRHRKALLNEIHDIDEQLEKIGLPRMGRWEP
ncbi:MAG: hypothetical protein GY701_28715 [Sulfitobacter sp.]|nr:hypothetical protein [Sulfitobacter sp.]